MNVLHWIEIFKMCSRPCHFVPFCIDGANSCCLLSESHYPTFKQKNKCKWKKMVESCQNILKSFKTPPTISWKSRPANAHKLLAPPKCQNLETKFIFMESECWQRFAGWCDDNYIYAFAIYGEETICSTHLHTALQGMILYMLFWPWYIPQYKKLC